MVVFFPPQRRAGKKKNTLQSWLMVQDCFFAMRILCTSVNGLQFIPSVSAIED